MVLIAHQLAERIAHTHTRNDDAMSIFEVKTDSAVIGLSHCRVREGELWHICTPTGTHFYRKRDGNYQGGNMKMCEIYGDVLISSARARVNEICEPNEIYYLLSAPIVPPN